MVGEDGRAMHKSWGNMVEFVEGAEKIGVDVMRWMFATHNPEQNLLFGFKKASKPKPGVSGGGGGAAGRASPGPRAGGGGVGAEGGEGAERARKKRPRRRSGKGGAAAEHAAAGPA